MLPKSHRLGLGQIAVHPQGTRLFGELMNIEAWVDPAAPRPAFAVVISKKVAKLATDRNRIKRQIYEAIGTVLPRVKPSIGVILYAKVTIVGRSYSQISEEVVNLFTKANVLA